MSSKIKILLKRVASGSVAPSPSPSPSPTPTPTPTPSGALFTIPSADTSRLSAPAATLRTSIIDTIVTNQWNPTIPSTGFVLNTNWFVVTTIAGFDTQILQCAANNPNGWNLIELDTGTYGYSQFGGGGSNPGPQFGAGGGCIIRPKTGATVTIDGVWIGQGNRLVFDGLTFTYTTSNGNNAEACLDFIDYFNQANGGPIAGRYIVQNCRFGAAYKTDPGSGFWARGINGRFCESLIIRNNTFNKVRRVANLGGRGYFEVTGNDAVIANEFGCQTQVGWVTTPVTRLVNPTAADQYVWDHHNLNRGCIESTGDIHFDYVQLTGGDDSYTEGWGHQTVIESNILTSSQTITGSNGSTTVYPTTEFFISSRVGTPQQGKLRAVLFNNLHASNGFMLQAGGTDCIIYAECNTTGLQPVRPTTTTGSDGGSGGVTAYGMGTTAQERINISKNILNAKSGTFTTDSGNVQMKINPAQGVGSVPSTYLAGPFTQDVNLNWLWSLGGTLSAMTAQAVIDKVIAIETPNGGVTAGAAFS
jgi:hypothetical protein